nr:SGNH/GDSL hydrolase family protein [Actinomycetota bacterium]
VPAATGTRGAGPEPVLLALGDSLASGYQPTYGRNPPPVDPATGYRDVGYPGGYASDLAAARHLALVDLACPGETTVSMTSTPAQPGCAGTYRAELHASSQLAAATSYLAGHPGRVALVTIDLGANDVDACVSASGASLSCLSSREAEVVSRLPAILATLRTALSRYDPRARLVGMNYYDPFLGVAYSPGGLVGTVGATLSLAAIASFDRRLGTVYAHAHAAVADVASAFHTAAALPLLSYRGHRLPADVVYVCRWTWMCPAPHSAIHQDIHATTVGYRVIASAFERVLGPA